ncbi:MAG: choice-of-anchor A family protein [Nostocaceae cyanobacterium]|nr:choice-of-anchor A family protein [Nostocaceae cyanobacterium]
MKFNTVLSYGKLAFPVMATLTLGLATATQAQAATLGPAADFNLFVLGDLTQSDTSVQGRVAVGGNATLSNYSAGNALTSSPNNGGTLVVGNNLSFLNGSVNGNVVYGGSADVTNANFNQSQGRPIDFNAAGAELRQISTSLSRLNVNGTTTINFGGISLRGTNSGLNVFNVLASDLAQANSFSIDAPADSTAIVNISGSNSNFSNMGFNLTGINRQQVLYNFFDATNLTASAIGIQGSLLAPNAAMEFNNGRISGNLIVGSLQGSGAIELPLFRGIVPNQLPPIPPSTSVPEPNSAAGLGLVSALAFLFYRYSKKTPETAQ